MAKSGSLEKVDPSSVAKATELKRELQRLVKSIAEEEDVPIDAFDQATQVISALKDLKSNRSQPSLPKFHRSQTSPQKNNPSSDSVPELFRCPISTQIMKDPVVLSSGATCDRLYIQSRLSQGLLTCPHTGEVLVHSFVAPNYFARSVISEWCKNQGIEVLKPVNETHHEEAITPMQRARVNELFCKISSGPLPEQRTAIKELRMLTKGAPAIRAMLGEDPESITRLTSLLRDAKGGSDVQENVVAAILNFSILDVNKKIVGEDPDAIPLLISAMLTGSMEARGNAAASLFTLSALDSNKAKIGECEPSGMEALARLMEEGNAIAKKDAAAAIFNLCVLHNNRSRAAKDGVVRAVLKTLKDGNLVDEMLAILAMLSTSQEATDVMSRHFGVPCFLQILRESTCGRNQENVAVILFSICMNDRTCLRVIREEEETKCTIAELARNGTPRARRKANGILDRMKRNMTHTA